MNEKFVLGSLDIFGIQENRTGLILCFLEPRLKTDYEIHSNKQIQQQLKL